MKYFFSIILLMLAFPSMSYSASRSLCTDKVLETNTIEGIYLGLECGDMCYGSLKMENDEIINFIIDEDDSSTILGKDPGNKVSITYEVQQFWNEYGNECSRVEVFKSGKIIAAGAEKTDDAKQTQSQPPSDGNQGEDSNLANAKADSYYEEDIVIPQAPLQNQSQRCPYKLEWKSQYSEAGTYYVVTITSVVDSLQINNIIVDRGNNIVFNNLGEVAALLFGGLKPIINYPKHLKFATRHSFLLPEKPLEIVFHTNHGTWTTTLD